MKRLALLPLLLAAACSDSTSRDDAGTPPPAPAAKKTFNVWVYGAPLGASPAAPLPDATVAFDPAGGGDRIEQQTDAEGRAVFEADVSTATATVTAYAKEHVIVTAYGVSEASVAKLPRAIDKDAHDLALVLPLSPAGLQARTVRFSGAIANKANATDRVNLGPVPYGVFFDDVIERFDLRAPKGASFELLGSEYVFDQIDARSASATIAKFFRFHEDARDVDATADLDIASAQEVSISKRNIHLDAPGGAAGPFGSTGAGRVNVGDPQLFVGPGVSTKMAPSPDDAGFDCEVTIAEIDLGATPLVTFGLLSASDRATSLRTEPGILADRSTMTGFLLPPVVTATRVTFAGEIPLASIPEEASVVEVDLASIKGVEWIGLVPHDAAMPDQVALPAMPTGATLPSSLTGTVSALADLTKVADGLLVAKKRSTSRPFAVGK